MNAMTQANATAQTARGCFSIDFLRCGAGGASCGRQVVGVGVVERSSRPEHGDGRGEVRRVRGSARIRSATTAARCGGPRRARSARAVSVTRLERASSGFGSLGCPAACRTAPDPAGHGRLAAAVRAGQRADRDRAELVELAHQPDAGGRARRSRCCRRDLAHQPGAVDDELVAQLLSVGPPGWLAHVHQYYIGVLCMSGGSRDRPGHAGLALLGSASERRASRCRRRGSGPTGRRRTVVPAAPPRAACVDELLVVSESRRSAPRSATIRPYQWKRPSIGSK